MLWLFWGGGGRGAFRKGLLASAAAALMAFAPSVYASDGPHGDGDGAVLPSLKVAVEGEQAPGTRGLKFDPVVGIDSWIEAGFASPKTNNDGNVAFRASYGNGYGAGIFGWAREPDQLIPIALTGQFTEAGFLPNGLDNYDGPSVNNQNQVAFGVRHMNEIIWSPADVAASPDFGNFHFVHSAVFQWCPEDGLKLVVKQGDPAPGGGQFDEFDGVSENDNGDIAFIATVEPSGDTGVFLKKAGKHEIRLIGLDDQLCPRYASGTVATGASTSSVPIDGGYFDLRGPWLNNEGDVLFEADCEVPWIPGTPPTTTPTTTPTTPPTTPVLTSPATTVATTAATPATPTDGAIDGSIRELPGRAVWIKKHDKPLRIFFAEGDRAPGGGYIVDWYIGQRGINDEELVATLEINNGRFEEVVATKKLERDDDHDRSHGPDLAGWDGHYDSGFEICAKDGQRIIDGYYLFINGGTPAIAEDGTIVFPGEAERAMRDSIDAFRPRPPQLPSDVSAIFSCRNHCGDGELGVVAFEGDKKPVDHYFRYGQLDDPSNGNCWATFIDETNYPTGVFLAPTQCDEDNKDGNVSSDSSSSSSDNSPRRNHDL